MQINHLLLVSMSLWSYGCARDVAKHERSVKRKSRTRSGECLGNSQLESCRLSWFCPMFFLYFSGESSKTSSISALFTLPIVEWYEAWYLYGLVGLKFYCSAIHPLTVLSLKLPFLPLMLTSVYCAVGVVWGWILFYCQTLRGKSSVVSTFQVTGMARKTSKKNQWISGSRYLLLLFSRLPHDHGSNSSSLCSCLPKKSKD